jgi:hypothetical protein
MAKQSKKRLNPNEKAFYVRYKAEERQKKNKIKKLEKHLRNSPEDKQAQEKLKQFRKEGVKYTRNKNKTGKPNDTVTKKVKRITKFGRLLRAITNYPELKPIVKEKNEKLSAESS